MNIDTNDMISISDVSKQGVSRLVNEASEGREFILIKNNKPAAALVGIEKLERLRRIEEDVKLLAMAVVRATTDTGERVSLSDAAARFGINLDELDDDDGHDDGEDELGDQEA
jgi:antitoxin (DNA-binding transcriptional repressor) of toxin-antitoxin stability system